MPTNTLLLWWEKITLNFLSIFASKYLEIFEFIDKLLVVFL
jgi:hypothetical protein